MREIKFRITYKRREDGHIWQLIVNPLEPGDGRRQMDQMLENKEWQLIAKDQFTGLTDKNGVEIYEGDILARPVDPKLTKTEYDGKKIKRHLHVAEWENSKRIGKTAGFYFRSLNPYPWFEGIFIPHIHYYEVIGNIHENAELLK